MSDYIEVFKIQRPLATNSKVPMALVYNRSRTHQFQMEMTVDIQNLFADGAEKIYHECVADPTDAGEFLIGPRVPDEDW